MILQALTQYYDALNARGEIDAPGWGRPKISYALQLRENGELTQVIPLLHEVDAGKKKVLRPREDGLRILSQISYGIIQPICWVLMAKENPTLLLNALQLPFYCTMNCLMMWTLLFLMRCWHFLIHGSLPKLHSTLLLSMITTKSFPVPIWYFM